MTTLDSKFKEIYNKNKVFGIANKTLIDTKDMYCMLEYDGADNIDEIIAGADKPVNDSLRLDWVTSRQRTITFREIENTEIPVGDSTIYAMKNFNLNEDMPWRERDVELHMVTINSVDSCKITATKDAETSKIKCELHVEMRPGRMGLLYIINSYRSPGHLVYGEKHVDLAGTQLFVFKDGNMAEFIGGEIRFDYDWHTWPELEFRLRAPAGMERIRNAREVLGEPEDRWNGTRWTIAVQHDGRVMVSGKQCLMHKGITG